MARHHSALRKLNRQCAPVLLGLSLVLVQGCSRPPAPTAEQFVGKWRSSRLASLPLTLASNGEWEIKGDGGAALQYGVWRIEGQRLIWTIRIDGGVVHDANVIVKVGADRFELREADGSSTQFSRLD
jgi:hypothetical protein